MLTDRLSSNKKLSCDKTLKQWRYIVKDKPINGDISYWGEQYDDFYIEHYGLVK